MVTGCFEIDRVRLMRRWPWQSRVLAALAVVTMGLTLAGSASAQRVHSDARLGPFLERLADAYQQEGEAGAVKRATLRGLRLQREAEVTLVPVILEPKPGLRAAQIKGARIRALGGRVDAVSESFVRVLMPFSRLRRLAAHPDIRIARAPTVAVESHGLGSYVSESVVLTGAEDLHETGSSGAGVDVAVLDLGFVGLSDAVGAGELPADTVIVNLVGSCDDSIETGTEHGVGVAEQVMNMAPAATLHVIKICDEVDLENAAAYLRVNGIRIANHSVGWVNASYYDDTGRINTIINDSHDLDGVFWAVAAGNDAERHWRGGWSDAGGDGWMDWSTGDEKNDLSASSSVCLFLNWDQYGNSVTDLDLYVLDRNDRIVAWSEAVQSGFQEPSEALCFSYDPAEAPYGAAVHLWSGATAGLDLTLFSFYNDLEYPVAAASLMDPAAAHGAVTVAAVFAGDFAGVDPAAEPYSGQGPTTDGRPKPDLTAPDGTTSFTYGPEGAYGTSFASPVVAGAAVLLLEDDPGLSAQDLAQALVHTAVDVGAPGRDFIFGWGLLQVELRPDCNDGVDNDGDGLTDYPADSLCPVDWWSTENPECGDGIDNDGDGLADYPDDPGCAAAFSPIENPVCSDGIDNDGDGFIDFPSDPGCSSAASSVEAPACDDGIDNDGDGLVDLADGKCTVASHRNEACGLGFELALLLPPLMRLYRRRRAGGRPSTRGSRSDARSDDEMHSGVAPC